MSMSQDFLQPYDDEEHFSNLLVLALPDRCTPTAHRLSVLQHGVLKVFRNNTSSDDDVRREATVLLLLEFHKVSGVPKLLEWTTNLAGGHKGEKQAILVEDGGRYCDRTHSYFAEQGMWR